MVRDLIKTDISNMPDPEFKATIIRILTGLEKRTENLSGTLTTEIKKLKSPINEIKNTLGAMNSRLEEAEDQINDLEDRVMESNQAEQTREKRIMQNENRLRKHNGSIKCNNIHIIGVPEEEEREIEKKIYLKK